MWSQKLDGSEGSEVQRKVVGCHVWACAMGGENWDGGEAQVGKRGGDVAGTGMV